MPKTRLNNFDRIILIKSAVNDNVNPFKGIIW